MRSKKIRGHRRRWKDIDEWVLAHKALDMDYLRDYERDYAKIRVYPWSGISVTNSCIPEPKGETRRRILQGLIDIYWEWKRILDNTNEIYFLKIWLFEPRFSQSQVVCAIGESLEYYKDTFYKPNQGKPFRPERYGRLTSKMNEFQWDYRLDEDHIYSSELGEPEDYGCQDDYDEMKRWLQQMLRKPHRTTILNDVAGETNEFYSFRKGKVWLGQI
ncbi:MAG: hypothetical protein ACEPOZ_12965 [Marinifilaceae bacterium]